MKTLLLIGAILQICLSIHKPHPEGKLDFIGMCSYNNYPVEEHKVITEDGYILTIFRVQSQGQTAFEQKDKVVLWQHGLFDSSDGPVCNSVDRAPIYVLANQGYDVWVGNSRGNKYSRSHITLSPKSKEFWSFSFHEMAIYDIPAILQYVTNYTNNKIHYIGHSQGTTQMFAALSLNIKGVKESLLSFNAMAPVAFLTQQESLLKLANNKLIPLALKSLNINEVLFPGWYNTQVGRLFCAYFDNKCQDMLSGLMDKDASINNANRVDVKISHFFAGTSTQNLFHWQQLLQSQQFQQYDHGTKENLARYGQPTPPSYPLDQISDVKINLFIGLADGLGDPLDAQILISKLSNVESLNWKEYYLGHSSFTMALDMSYLNDLIAFINSE